MSPRRGLLWQINLRLLLALLLALLFSLAIGTWVYRESNARTQNARISTQTTHLQSLLSQIERSWGRSAYNFRARIEYTHILEDAARRGDRLAAYLTAQGSSPTFPYLRILDGKRVPLITYAPGLDQLPPHDANPEASTYWQWDDAGKVLFRVFQQPVWLGGGNGTLQLFKAADHSLLNGMSLPDSEVAMFWEGRPVAASGGGEGVAVAEEKARQIRDERQWVDWGAQGAASPRLLILDKGPPAFAPIDLVLPLGVATLVFALAAWGTLGRWSLLSLRRIQALRQAQEQFADDRSLDGEVEKSLDVARGTVDDEIADVAETMSMMMATIVSSEAAEYAARDSMVISERRFRMLVEGTNAIAWEFDLTRNAYDYVSPQAEGLLGYPLAAWQQPGFFATLLPADEAAEIIDRRQRNFFQGSGGGMEYRVVRRDGRGLWLHDMTAPLTDDHGAVTRVIGLTIDITDRKHAEQRLSLSDLVVHHASEGVMVTDTDNRIVSVNPAFEMITGYSADEVIGRGPSLLKSGLQDQPFYRDLWATLLAKGRWNGELWNRRKTGELYAQRASIVAVPDERGRITRYVSLFSDITVEKQQEEELLYQAGHDPLTGLPNRRLLGDRIESAMARARRDQTKVGILILDLDGFKHINDTLGHLTGDHVLVDVAKRINHTLRETDTLARLGGDEFMVLVEGLDDQDDLRGIAGKILTHIQEPLHIDGHDLYVTTSIGITVFPDDGQSVTDLFASADTALYRAKAEGRNAFRFFTTQMHENAIERMEIETELRRALPNNEFVLFYQPVVELATGRIAKAEALVRWLHPQRGLVPPNEFIPIAEDTGIILPLGQWIVSEAARQSAAWNAVCLPEFKICVNFSAYQFRRSDPIAMLGDALQASGIGSGRIAVEITESMFMDDEAKSLSQLRILRERGFEIAIDDFGTGYSSLSYLQRLPVDTLKVDRSFVMGIPDDVKSIALINAMLSLGRTFGLHVVAEGIETETQASFLRERGCRYGQGYYFGRPVPADEFARRYLSAQRV